MNKEILFLLLLPVIGYLIVLFSIREKDIPDSALTRFGFTKPHSKWLLFYRLSGFFFLGLLPLMAIQKMPSLHFEKLGIGIGYLNHTIGFSALFLLVFAILIFQISRSPKHQALYPPWREWPWSKSLKQLNFVSWFLYLLGYEIFFRGVLLFWVEDYSGYWMAIWVNILVYTLAHLHKNKEEVWGSIPLGFIYAIVCLEAGSFIPAFVGHFTMAWFNDWICLRRKTVSKISQ